MKRYIHFWHGHHQELKDHIASFCPSETIDGTTHYYWEGSIDDFMDRYKRYPILVYGERICVTQYSSFSQR